MNAVEFLRVNDDYVTPNSPNVGYYLESNGFPPDRKDLYFDYPCYKVKGPTFTKVAAHVQSKGAILRYVAAGRDDRAEMPTTPATLAERREAAVSDLVRKGLASRKADREFGDAVGVARGLGLTDLEVVPGDAGGGPVRVAAAFDDEAPAGSWPEWTDRVTVAPLRPGTRTTFAQVPVGHWYSLGRESRKVFYRKTSNRRSAQLGDPDTFKVEMSTRVTYEGERAPCDPSGW